MVYKMFEKKTGSGVSVNEKLAQEIHKPVIQKIERRKIYAEFKDNIWAADLVELGSLYSSSGFIEIVNKSKHKPHKLWVDQGRDFNNNLFMLTTGYVSCTSIEMLKKLKKN